MTDEPSSNSCLSQLPGTRQGRHGAWLRSRKGDEALATVSARVSHHPQSFPRPHVLSTAPFPSDTLHGGVHPKEHAHPASVTASVVLSLEDS